MKNLLKYLLEFLLPQPKIVRNLESMTAEELLVRAPKARAGSLSQTFVLFDYKNPLIRQAIWELKYRGNPKIATLLADCLFDSLAEEVAEKATFENFTSPILIPIPLSKKRRKERGFNQTELLAGALSKSAGLPVIFEIDFGILLKIKDTESQTKKNRAERLENLRDCFKISLPEKIAGRNIILLDDVVTTGATFEEARKTLIQAGARKIFAVAVAH